MPPHAHISSLFSPRSVAVIGASDTPGKIGHIVLNNLIQAGFSGKIYPVNPKGGKILGLPVIRKPAEIPEPPLDLAVLCVPAASTVDVMHKLGALGTRAAVIIGAGFKETGGVGARLEEKIKKTAARYQIALLGPNCLGLVNNACGLNVTFAAGTPVPGNIGFFAQSGAFCIAIFDWARDQNIGFSSFVSLGNKAILDESDIIMHMADDPDTKVILGYLESVEDGPRFLHCAAMATRKKPIILLKAGRTKGGARAASSHTGALAGADIAYEAVFQQTGIIRVDTMQDLFTMAQAFASQPLPQGPGLAIITNSGGPGIVATDACETAGLSLAQLSPQTINRLKEILPPYAAFFNPVDVIGDADVNRINETIRVVSADPAVDSILVLAAPTAQIPLQTIAEGICSIAGEVKQPLFACLMGGHNADLGKAVFVKHNIPCYAFPEPAIRAVATMYRQNKWKDKPLPVEINYRRDPSRARKVIDEARAQARLEVVEFQAQGILQAYEMPLLEAKLARTSDEAVQIAKQFNCPVALKIASPQISHKTDVQGVELGLETPEAIKSAFKKITTKTAALRKDAYIAGCLVQRMAPPGAREVIIGFKRDLRFGPMVLFGLGGVHVEAFKDVVCRLAPLSLDDVQEMIRSIKAFPILAGVRGQKPVKFTAIEDILLIMSQLALDFPDIEEAECNPVLVTELGAHVADIRLMLRKEGNTLQEQKLHVF